MSHVPLVAKIAFAAGAVAIAGYAVQFRRQNRRMREIVTGFEQLEQLALSSASQTEYTGVISPPETLPPDGCFRTIAGLEFSYFILQRPDGDFEHHVVGRGDGAVYLSETMLLIMRTLVQQFAPAGMEHEVMLHVETLKTGTQHIDFMVSAEQQAALLRVIQPRCEAVF